MLVSRLRHTITPQERDVIPILSILYNTIFIHYLMEEWKIEALEQYNAEQEALKEYYNSLPEPHKFGCNCPECN